MGQNIKAFVSPNDTIVLVFHNQFMLGILLHLISLSYELSSLWVTV